MHERNDTVYEAASFGANQISKGAKEAMFHAGSIAASAMAELVDTQDPQKILNAIDKLQARKVSTGINDEMITIYQEQIDELRTILAMVYTTIADSA